MPMHIMLYAKKIENTKYLENKLNTLVLSTVSSTLSETEKWYFFIVKIFLLPDWHFTHQNKIQVFQLFVCSGTVGGAQRFFRGKSHRIVTSFPA